MIHYKRSKGLFEHRYARDFDQGTTVVADNGCLFLVTADQRFIWLTDGSSKNTSSGTRVNEDVGLNCRTVELAINLK